MGPSKQQRSRLDLIYQQSTRCIHESIPAKFNPRRRLGVGDIECVAGATSRTSKSSNNKIRADRCDATFLTHILTADNVVESALTEDMEKTRDMGRFSS